MIEIKHLITLRTIHELGSLVEAADKLCVTQSALSHQLKDLERRLDITLVLRKSRPLRLTVAGERLIELGNTILPMIKSTEREIARLAGGETGRLHIAIECHSCFNWLMPAINQYREHWSEVELDLSTAFNFIPLPALLRGDLDLVLTSDPQSLPGIVYQPLFRYEMKVAMSNEHASKGKDFLDASDFEHEVLITYPVDTDRLDLFSQVLDQEGIEPVEIRTAELTMMMVQLVASGRGICALPNWALKEYLDAKYVTALPIGEKGLWSKLYFAYRAESHESAYVQEFIKIAKELCFETLDGIKVLDE